VCVCVCVCVYIYIYNSPDCKYVHSGLLLEQVYMDLEIAKRGCEVALNYAREINNLASTLFCIL
jgi:hypothetical protein